MEDRGKVSKAPSKKSQKDEKQKKRAEAYNKNVSEKDNNINLNTLVEIKNNAWSYSIVILIVSMVLLSLFLQYKHERQMRMSKETDEESEVNLYEVLGVSQNADLATIRKQYKELTKVWHPDKNPGCKPCQEKFLQISKAYELLSDEVKKGEIDSKGSKSIFGSQPTHLTVRNYHHLVEESNDFWVILIYENTRGNNYNKFVAEVWDEVSSKKSNIVKFGVIDVLQNENLLHFLPYKFQYYPNIITYLHGESSELLQNMESFSVNSLAQFIDNSFVSKVQIIDENGLIPILNKSTSPPKEISSIKYEDIDISLIILSSRNYVDLVAKDFAKNYHHSLTVYQNDMGNFDKFMKAFKASENNNRVYIQYNEIIPGESTDKIKLQNVLKPLPVIFKTNSNISERLQVAFNILKSLTLQRIYKNNYTKHCVNKVTIRGEDLVDRNQSENKINMCMILLEHNNDLNSNSINSAFYQNLFVNFNKRISKATSREIKNSEEYAITVNYGITALEKNKKLLKLYNSFITEKGIQVPSEKSKLFFIINDTQEKFTFKFFKDDIALTEFLTDFDKSDFFEDYSFSVCNYIFNTGISSITS